MFRRTQVVETRDVERRALLDCPTLAGVPVRDNDIEPAKGLHSIAKLFRVLAAMMVVLIAVDIFNGMTAEVRPTVSAMATDAIRLLLFAGLLWGGGDLADLLVKSHYDLRATRILLGRLTRRAEQPEQQPSFGSRLPTDPPRRRRTDIMH
jgi:hypothetical protein